jgi:phytanoyl-CoA hydroxylase
MTLYFDVLRGGRAHGYVGPPTSPPLVRSATATPTIPLMLTTDQVAEFQQKGFLLGPRVLDSNGLDVLRAELERVITSSDGPQPLLKQNLGTVDAPVWQIVNIWFASDPFRELLSHPAIVEDLVQLSSARRLRVWHDQVQYKPPGFGGVTMWHQDSPLWPVEPKTEQLTAWVALDDADETNGCMSMVPGSHQWGDHVAFLLATERFEHLPAMCEGHSVVPELRPVKAGHVHYHHALTWHGSNLNRTDRPRRAIGIHYMTEQTRLIEAADPTARAFAANYGVTSAPGDLIEGPNFVTVFHHGRIRDVRPLREARPTIEPSGDQHFTRLDAEAQG